MASSKQSRPEGAAFAFPQDKITIGYLSAGQPAISFFDSLMATYEYDRYRGPGRFDRHLWRIGHRGHVNISRGRCKMVRQFLAGKGQWLLMIDDDMSWPHDAHEKQLRAIEATAQAKGVEPWQIVMGGLTFGWLPDATDIAPVMYARSENGTFVRMEQELPAAGTIRQVAGTGAAFLMIHRKMFEEIESTLLELGAATQAPWFREHEQPIIDEWDEEGNPTHATTYWVSEDLWFCDQVARVGGGVFVNMAVETGHKKEIMLTRGLHEKRDLVIA